MAISQDGWFVTLTLIIILNWFQAVTKRVVTPLLLDCCSTPHTGFKWLLLTVMDTLECSVSPSWQRQWKIVRKCSHELYIMSLYHVCQSIHSSSHTEYKHTQHYCNWGHLEHNPASWMEHLTPCLPLHLLYKRASTHHKTIQGASLEHCLHCCGC